VKSLMSGGRQLAVAQAVEALMVNQPGVETEEYAYFDPKAAPSGVGTDGVRPPGHQMHFKPICLPLSLELVPFYDAADIIHQSLHRGKAAQRRRRRHTVQQRDLLCDGRWELPRVPGMGVIRNIHLFLLMLVDPQGASHGEHQPSPSAISTTRTEIEAGLTIRV